MLLPALLIFDMDGLMFDTERISKPCWIETAKKFGYDLPDDVFDAIFGRNERQIEAYMKECFGPQFPFTAIYQKKLERMYHIYETDGVPMEPGLVELLSYARRKGIPCVVASSTILRVVQTLVNRAGIGTYFQRLFSGHDLPKSKPDPEIFLKVCQEMGVKPERALVFEDSGNGLLAAKNGNIPAIWVPDLVEVPQDIAATAWHRCQTLADAIPLLDGLCREGA